MLLLPWPETLPQPRRSRQRVTSKDNAAVVGNEPGEMDDYQAYPAYRRGRGRWIREWLLPLLCFAAILTLSLVAARQWYFITDHELRLCIQIGMTIDRKSVV